MAKGIQSHRKPTAEELLAVARGHKLEIPDESARLLANYAGLLWEWNAKINLTRHDTTELFVARDLVDVLALSQFLEPGERVLDIGSGGGVPGLPLAILRPDLNVELCDSVAKKARVLEDMVARLDVSVRVHSKAGQEVVAVQWFDSVVARGVAPLDKMARWFVERWDDIGQLLVIKGPKWTEERSVARRQGLLNYVELRKIHEYPREGMDAPSVVLRLRREPEHSKDAS